MKKHELLNTMDAHFQTYLRARSLCPYIPESIIPASRSDQSDLVFIVPTAPLYQNKGYKCCIVFVTDQFNTPEKYQQYQDIGHWINQSFFIELECIMKTFITNWKDFINGIDNVHIRKCFQLLSQCRNLFAHSSYKLDYLTEDKKRKEKNKIAISLYKELFSDLKQPESGFNLSIDDFVMPLYDKLYKWINDNL